MTLNLNDVNSKVNFQKMRSPLFMFYSKFLFGHHTNPRLAILRDFAEVCIEFRSLLRESSPKTLTEFSSLTLEKKV